MSHTKAEIPTISIAPWLDGSARDDVVEAVRSACKTYGFFQLVGHGIPLESQKQIFEAAKTFFELPMEEKMKLAKDPISGRGYEAPGTQALQPGQVPDDKEVT
jgi:isopenicillin N synthase-like dioxygenase